MSIRVRSTPCHSGVTFASVSIHGSRLAIGKNAPEKRKSGIIPSRKTSEKALSSLSPAEKAKIGAAKARPTRSWTGKASTAPHTVAKTPNGAITTRKTAQVSPTRKSTKPRWPSTTSRTESGVAVMPK